MKNDGAFAADAMSLRDWFAGMALTAIGAHLSTPEEIAQRSYDIADAMLVERERGKNEA